MKRLDELGVSPAPWAHNANKPAVYDSDGGCVAGCDLHFDRRRDIADARLVAAAPCLYEALREAVIESCHDCNAYARDGNRCTEANSQCFIQRWRKALEKAEGAE